MCEQALLELMLYLGLLHQPFTMLAYLILFLSHASVKLAWAFHLAAVCLSKRRFSG